MSNICFTAKIFRPKPDCMSEVEDIAYRRCIKEWCQNDGIFFTFMGVDGSDREEVTVRIPTVAQEKRAGDAHRVVIENMAGKTVDVFNYKGDAADLVLDTVPPTSHAEILMSVRKIARGVECQVPYAICVPYNSPISLWDGVDAAKLFTCCRGNGSALYPYEPVFTDDTPLLLDDGMLLFTHTGIYRFNGHQVSIDRGEQMPAQQFISYYDNSKKAE